MMDGEGPKEPEADATVFLPAAVGAELKIPLSLYMSSLHHVLLFPLYQGPINATSWTKD